MRLKPSGSFFSLSTILFIIISFLVVAIGEFGPHQAESPLYAAMVPYQLLFAPIGVWAVYRESSERELPRRLQFGLRQMLVGMGTLIVAATVLAIAAPAWVRSP